MAHGESSGSSSCESKEDDLLSSSLGELNDSVPEVNIPMETTIVHEKSPKVIRPPLSGMMGKMGKMGEGIKKGGLGMKQMAQKAKAQTAVIIRRVQSESRFETKGTTPVRGEEGSGEMSFEAALDSTFVHEEKTKISETSVHDNNDNNKEVVDEHAVQMPLDLVTTTDVDHNLTPTPHLPAAGAVLTSPLGAAMTKVGQGMKQIAQKAKAQTVETLRKAHSDIERRRGNLSALESNNPQKVTNDVPQEKIPETHVDNHAIVGMKLEQESTGGNKDTIEEIAGFQGQKDKIRSQQQRPESAIMEGKDTPGKRTDIKSDTTNDTASKTTTATSKTTSFSYSSIIQFLWLLSSLVTVIPTYKHTAVIWATIQQGPPLPIPAYLLALWLWLAYLSGQIVTLEQLLSLVLRWKNTTTVTTQLPSSSLLADHADGPNNKDNSEGNKSALTLDRPTKEQRGRMNLIKNPWRQRAKQRNKIQPYTSLCITTDSRGTAQPLPSWLKLVDPLRHKPPSRQQQAPYPNPSLVDHLLQVCLEQRQRLSQAVGGKKQEQESALSTMSDSASSSVAASVATHMGDQDKFPNSTLSDVADTFERDFEYVVEPLLKIRGMDVFLTKGGEEYFDIGSHSWLQKQGLRRIPSFVVNGVTEWGNILVYLELPLWLRDLSSSLQVQPNDSKTIRAFKRFLSGSDEYRNARLKAIPSVVDGPMAVKIMAPPKRERVLHGSLIPVSWYKHDVETAPDGQRLEPIVICAIDFVSGRAIRTMASIVKKYLVQLTIDLALVIGAPSTKNEGDDVEEDQGETPLCLGLFRFASIDVEQCPDFPPPNEDEDDNNSKEDYDEEEDDIATARLLTGISQDEWNELHEELIKDQEQIPLQAVH